MDDPLHMEYVVAAANLFARQFGIPETDVRPQGCNCWLSCCHVAIIVIIILFSHKPNCPSSLSLSLSLSLS